VENEEASARVTLRQCLNHSAGWVGDDEQDFGRSYEEAVRELLLDPLGLERTGSSPMSWRDTRLLVAIWRPMIARSSRPSSGRCLAMGIQTGD
jgi:CubicO group peptidase (beta-lactamase class C family)